MFAEDWTRTGGSPSQGDERIRKTCFSYSETTQRGRLLRKQKSSPVPGAKVLSQKPPCGVFLYLLAQEPNYHLQAYLIKAPD